LDNSGYLFAVYSIVWVVLFLYVLYLMNGQRKLRKEIMALKKTLEEKNRQKSP
jgi:CcmD family protein